LKELFNDKETVGDCDFCPSENVKCIEVSELCESFVPIFQFYREIEYGRDFIKGDDPINHGEFLPDLIENEWHPIFSDDFDLDKSDEFWDSLVEQKWIDKDNLPLDLSGLYVMIEDSFEDYWDSFSDYLKTNRRFTIKRDDVLHFADFLPELLSGIEVKVNSGDKYYRARLGTGEETEPFPKEKMGAPPPEKTLTGGRANPPGIPFLYLSDEEKTAIAEVRPWKGATVSIATFTTKKDINLVDLTPKFYIDDPFSYGDKLEYVIKDNSILRRLAKELSKPINPGKISIEYVPTQYVTEIIRNFEYDGMIYPSALGKGKNIVLFDEAVVECMDDVKLHYVKSVDYHSSEKEFFTRRKDETQ
jgi:RES domain-containing protein